jgi:hypothetical protein
MNEHLRSFLGSAQVTYKLERIVESQRKRDRTKIGASPVKAEAEYSASNLSSEDFGDPAPWSSLNGQASTEPGFYKSVEGFTALTQWEFVLNDFTFAVDGWFYGSETFPTPFFSDARLIPAADAFEKGMLSVSPTESRVRYRVWERIYVAENDIQQANQILQTLISAGPAKCNACNMRNIDFALRSIGVDYSAQIMQQIQFQNQSTTQAHKARNRLSLNAKGER